MFAFFPEILANLIDSILQVYFILGYCNKSLKNNKHSIIFILLICMVLSVSSFIAIFSSLGTIIGISLSFLFSFSLKNNNRANSIIAPFLFIIITPIINIITLNIFKLFAIDHDTLLIYGSPTRLISLAISKVLLILTIFIILKMKHKSISFSSSEIFVYFIFPFVSIGIILYMSETILKYGIEAISYSLACSLLGIISINFAILYLFERITVLNNEKIELKLLNTQLAYEKDKYLELQNLYEHIKSIRHDFSKHITFVKQLLENKNYDEAFRYIQTMHNSGELNNVLVQSGNRTLDFIINSKVSANNDIKFSIIGSVTILPNEAYDLVVLIGNMLDNAIEAARNSKDRIVEIQFLATDYYQNIICRNSIDRSVLSTNPALKTTKKNTEHHGLGVKSIKKIAEKYFGLVDFFEEKGQFCVQVSLPICEIEKVANANVQNIA